jgi:hypothetical protein
MCLLLKSSLAAQLRGRGTAEGGGGGGSAGIRGCTNVLEHSVEVLQNFVGRDPYDTNASALKPVVTNLIPLWPITPAVCFSIDLDRDIGGSAKEIEHVRPSGMLPPVLKAVRFLSELTPQQHFRQAH